MKVPVVNAEGKEVGTQEILASWERRPVVLELLHQAVVAAAANARVHYAHTKGRGEVRGGGRKPWKQKGTGRARHGSIRSPLWKGGGVTFGPRNEEIFRKRFPAAMRRTALAMALVAKARDAEVTITDVFPETTKTKELDVFVRKLGVRGSVLLLAPESRRASLVRAGRNLPRTVVADPALLTAADVLQVRQIVATAESWSVLEARLQTSASKAAKASEASEALEAHT